MDSKIKSLKAREILDSGEKPTVEVELITNVGSFFSSVPSGTSKGKYEAVELRDGGERHEGKGVLRAVKNVNEVISQKLRGEDVREQAKIDQILIALDGTKNKSKLGVNAILPVSMVVCRAGAAAENVPLYKYINKIFTPATNYQLPSPSLLLIEGGLHAENKLSVQEFMILPQGDSFKEKFERGVEIYRTLGLILEKEYGKSVINLGQEGAFTVPALKTTIEALDIILRAVKEAKCQEKVKIALDIAASSFFRDGVYRFEGQSISKENLLNFYQELFKQYPIFSIEDPFSEDDWEGFQMITKQFGNKILIIGDDLLVTNLERMKEAQTKNACNGMILKPNQIGTVTESIEAAQVAKSFGWKIMASHRARETDDDFIADLAVGIGADFIKAGAPAKKERMAKYNRLLRIEEEMK